MKTIEEVREMIGSLKNNQDQSLCFFGWNDGRKRAMRLYICYDSDYNLYSKLLRYEPLLGKCVKQGKTTWGSLKESLGSDRDDYVLKFSTVRLIHFDYPATGMETDHGVQICSFESLDMLMGDIVSIQSHCFLANPKDDDFDYHAFLTKEQMFKDAICFGENKTNFKFLFEWGDDIEKICNRYIPTTTPTPATNSIKKPKDQRYYLYKRMLKVSEELLKLYPENTEVVMSLKKAQKSLEEYEDD